MYSFLILIQGDSISEKIQRLLRRLQSARQSNAPPLRIAIYGANIITRELVTFFCSLECCTRVLLIYVGNKQQSGGRDKKLAKLLKFKRKAKNSQGEHNVKDQNNLLNAKKRSNREISGSTDKKPTKLLKFKRNKSNQEGNVEKDETSLMSVDERSCENEATGSDRKSSDVDKKKQFRDLFSHYKNFEFTDNIFRSAASNGASIQLNIQKQSITVKNRYSHAEIDDQSKNVDYLFLTESFESVDHNGSWNPREAKQLALHLSMQTFAMSMWWRLDYGYSQFPRIRVRLHRFFYNVF